MKPKNKIKLRKSVAKVISETTELVNSMIELHKLKSKPIPEYKRFSDLNKETGEKLKAIDKSIGRGSFGGGNYENHFTDSFEYFLKSQKVFLENTPRSGKYDAQEAWNKQLNEYLKGKGFKNDEPFGMDPVEDKSDKKFSLMLGSDLDNKIISAIENKNTKVDWNNIYKVVENKTPTAPPLGFNHDFHKGMLEADKELRKVCKPKVDCLSGNYPKMNLSGFLNLGKHIENSLKTMIEIDDLKIKLASVSSVELSEKLTDTFYKKARCTTENNSDYVIRNLKKQIDLFIQG